MSEYADMAIRNLTLFSFKNYLVDDIITLFYSKKDLIIIPNYKEECEDEDLPTYTKYVYKTTVQRAIERLDAQGYSIKNFEAEFNEKMINAIDYSPFLAHLHIDYDDHEIKAKERLQKHGITFAKWKNSLNKIIGYELENGNIYRSSTVNKISITTECDKIIFYSTVDSDCDSIYGIHSEVIAAPYIYRLILECCDPEDSIVLDFSYLDNWAEDCIPKALAATENVEKTIVLVEGTSDKDILEFALKHIYPHLSDLFYFMDFENNTKKKRDGGSSYVVKNLKTFYFAKIKSRFIAIFDNDAEGYQCQCALLDEIKKWPNNFRILLYPENTLFHSYPTLVPNGSIMLDDINKKACSIELYLPDSMIMPEGKYCPIEWEARKKFKVNGAEKSLYQGVISQKDEIKARFHDMRKKIEDGKCSFEIDEWKRMQQLLSSIVFSFR